MMNEKAKPTPTPMAGPKTRIAPMQSKDEAKRQEKALAELMKKRQMEARRTGNWNNYGNN
jgi:hypothetical protein